MSSDLMQLARQVLDIEAQSILDLKNRIGAEFEQAVQHVIKCKGKVVFTGLGKSGHVARKLASTFSSTGTPAVFVHPSETGHGDLGMIVNDDLLVCVSYGGETPELEPVLSFASRRGISIVAFTGNAKSTLAKAATVLLDVSVNREACPLELAPTASSTATLAMGDALAMAVMQLKNFSAKDFAEYHPGGSLGFRLSSIKEKMHTGRGFVAVEQNTELRKVFSSMSNAESRGAAAVVDSAGDLVGVITDGDIRRRLENNPSPVEGKALDMMTKNPRTIDAGEVSEKALFLMEQFKINLLFVLDKNSATPKKPVGIVHIQDLLRHKIR